MNNLENTYRVYKDNCKAVPLDHSGAGFNCLKAYSGPKMYGLGGSFPSGWQVKTVAPFHLKVTKEEVIDSLFGGHILITDGFKVLTTLFESFKNSGWTVDESELVANNLVNEDEKDSLAIGSPFLFRINQNNIKGRVERDCLNTLQSILYVL